MEWVRKWLSLRDRLVEIAKVLRKFPWMVEVVRQRASSTPTWWRYVAKDGSEACLSLTSSKAYCARDGAAREAGAGLQQIRSVRGEDERGAPPQGAIGIHHRGERIRKATLATSFSGNRQVAQLVKSVKSMRDALTRSSRPLGESGRLASSPRFTSEGAGRHEKSRRVFYDEEIKASR